MNKHQLEALLYAAVCIARAYPDAGAAATTQELMRLQKAAQSLHKRYEAMCSYEWANTPQYERRTEKLEEQARESARLLGVDLQHQRDPRGWPLILSLSGGEIGRLG